MKRFFRNNGLTLAAMALFFGSWIGQIITGFFTHNEELKKLGGAHLEFGSYLISGHFFEATFENWESEFLQMAIFVYLSAFLFQKGSAESNPLPEEGEDQPEPNPRYFVGRPLLRKLYENSLSLALMALFLISFAGHIVGGWMEENSEDILKGQPEKSLAEFIAGSEFWFQSFQNWQSEFLSLAAIIFLTIYLRQKDSAQSKAVDAPHSKTGD